MTYRRTLLASFLGIAGLIAGGNDALGQDQKSGKSQPGAAPGAKGSDGQGPRGLDASAFIKRHDKNNDNKLSQDELTGRIRGDFDVLDRDDDGYLTAQELEQHGQRMMRRMHPESVSFVWIISAEKDPPSLQDLQKAYEMMRKIDSNSDGKITQDEIKSARSELCKKRVESIIEQNDDNDDGKLDRQEGTSIFGRRFEQADRNNDGFVTREELMECVTQSPSGQASDGGSDENRTRQKQ